MSETTICGCGWCLEAPAEARCPGWRPDGSFNPEACSDDRAESGRNARSAA